MPETYLSQFWKIQSPTDLVSGEDLLPDSYKLSSGSVLIWQKGQGRDLPGASFTKILIPFMRALLSRFNHFPKAPLSSAIVLGIRFLHGNW